MSITCPVLSSKPSHFGPSFLQSLVHDLLGHDPFTLYDYEHKVDGEWTTEEVMLDDSDPVWRLVGIFRKRGVCRSISDTPL